MSGLTIPSRDGGDPEASSVRAELRNATEVASKTCPGLSNSPTEDALALGILVSFLSPSHPITYDFLFRGGSPRKRWTQDGGMEEVDAITAGLSPKLTRLLSDSHRLSHALDDLLMTVLEKSAQAYILDEEAASQVRQGMPADELLFWKAQALIVAYRAVPWKYIEPSNVDFSSILPHLQFASQTYEDCYESLSPTTRADLILTLLEASRFPTIVWKRFAVAQAAAAMRGVNHEHPDYWYLSLCLSTKQSLLHRLDGRQGEAVDVLRDFIHQQHTVHTRRANAAMGHLTLQRAHNRYQVDDLTQAEKLLKMWRPLEPGTSLMEQVVQHRKGAVLGRALRTQGRFAEAFDHLKDSMDLEQQLLHDLTFDEDRRDMTCEMADVMRELGIPGTAELYLGEELGRRQEDGRDPPASGKSLLEASMAEVLFAQGRYEEAERLCIETNSRADNLMKMGKLRISVVLAKICQLRSDHEGALRHWDEAMRQVARFPGATGRTTRTILLSRRENMRALGITADAREQSQLHTASLDALGTPGGMLYWIAGMRHWQEFLDSETSRSRM